MATQTDRSKSVDSVKQISIRDALVKFMATVDSDKKQEIHPEISRFASHIGPEKLASELLPSDIDQYGASLGPAASQAYRNRIESIKDFLIFLKKNEYIQDGLSKHMRARKPSTSGAHVSVMRRRDTEVQITQQGFNEMTKQLEKLQIETIRISSEIEKAAASGDVRENAPLEAARENQGMVQSQIRRLESTLKSAVIIDEAELQSRESIQIGSWVRLKKMNDGSTMEYQIVAANEANPLRAKISDISPVGRAIIGGKPGKEVMVKTPSGEQQFRIESIF